MTSAGNNFDHFLRITLSKFSAAPKTVGPWAMA